MNRFAVLSLVCVLLLAGLAMAQPTQNGSFIAPEIGGIVCDGDLSDWADATEWSDPYIFWAGAGDPNSTTTARFAWNDPCDLLYVAVVTDADSVQIGGHLVIGVSLCTEDPCCVPVAASEPRATQLMFDVAAGNSVDIGNEIQYYEDKYSFGWAGGGVEGVQAGQTVVVDGSTKTTTYEIAIPFWDDWVLMSDGGTISPQELSVNTVVYLYSVMETALESADGTNMTYDGNITNPQFAFGAWDRATEITLKPFGYIGTCQDMIDAGYGLSGDTNSDCYVTVLDLAILADGWLKCNDPANSDCGN